MKVLILSQFFWPESFRLNDMSVGLRENGHEVTVLTGIPNYPKGSFFPGYGFFRKTTEDYCGMKVRRVPIIPRGNGGVLRLILNYISFMFSACLVGPFICSEKYDLILFSLSPFVEGMAVRFFRWIKKAPVVFWVQDLWPESLSATGSIKNKFLLTIVERIMKFIYRGCDRVLIQSRAFEMPIRKMGVEKEKICYFPNGAEELYKPVQIEKNSLESSEMPSGFKIMFAGNIGAAQSFETIINAAKQINENKNIQWVILGDGRKFDWVKKKVEEFHLEDTVRLLGRRPIDAMPKYFALADVMLVTLKNEPIFTLTVPAKIQSYLACGKPILAALNGEGARVISEANAGMSCSPENPMELAQTALAMYNMTESKRREMGFAGRKYFEKCFDRRMLINQLSLIVEETAGKSKG